MPRGFLFNIVQRGVAHEPYEDCVAAMRLYKRIRSQRLECEEGTGKGSAHDNSNPFTVFKQKDVEAMTPDALLKISWSNYYCWCLDAALQS